MQKDQKDKDSRLSPLSFGSIAKTYLQECLKFTIKTKNSFYVAFSKRARVVQEDPKDKDAEPGSSVSQARS